MVAFEKLKVELSDLEVKVIAASVDTGDDAKAVADDVSFTVGQGVTREHAELMGSWYGDARHPEMIQPSEFLVKNDGKILMCSYSAGPLARMDPSDLVKVVNFINNLSK